MTILAAKGSGKDRAPFVGTSAAQRSDVSHFYLAAHGSSVLGPLGALVLCVGYDLVLSPMKKVAKGMLLHEAVKYDWRQFGVDFAGVRYGARLEGWSSPVVIQDPAAM